MSDDLLSAKVRVVFNTGIYRATAVSKRSLPNSDLPPDKLLDGLSGRLFSAVMLTPHMPLADFLDKDQPASFDELVGWIAQRAEEVQPLVGQQSIFFRRLRRMDGLITTTKTSRAFWLLIDKHKDLRNLKEVRAVAATVEAADNVHAWVKLSDAWHPHLPKEKSSDKT